MSIGITALPPAPWTPGPVSETLYDPSGAVLCHFFHGGTEDSRKQAHAAMEFVSKARRVFDVMTRLRLWGLENMMTAYFCHYPLSGEETDIFTLILEADEWMTAKEAKGAVQ